MPVLLATAAAAVDTCERRSGSAGRRAADRLLRGYLHKTSNTLCGIKGYASLIAGTAEGGGDSARWAAKILQEIEKMEVIFQSVQDLTGPRRPAPQQETLAPVVADAVRAATERWPGLKVAGVPLPAARLLLPAADLAQVLGEVLDNAADCAPGRPQGVAVRIFSSADSSGTLVLSVADDGPGIAPDLLQQVKDPFVTTRPGRLGIGLSRVDTIMDMHNLKWSLDSLPGQGTTVSLETATLG